MSKLRRLLVRLHLREPNPYEQEILAEAPLFYWRLDGRDEGVVYQETLRDARLRDLGWRRPDEALDGKAHNVHFMMYADGVRVASWAADPPSPEDVDAVLAHLFPG